MFSLIGPKRYDAPWKDIESQGWIAPAECTEVRVTLTDAERMAYATAEPEERYRIAADRPHQDCRWSSALVERHPGDQVLVIGAYLDQLRGAGRLPGRADHPGLDHATGSGSGCSTRSAPARSRPWCVSKVGNFSIDLPEAAVAIQVSGTFGSRQEEAQRLGRVLRPKADGRQAHFYTVVSPGHPRHRVRRPPAALPGRAGLRVHDRRRRRRAGPVTTQCGLSHRDSTSRNTSGATKSRPYRRPVRSLSTPRLSSRAIAALAVG